LCTKPSSHGTGGRVLVRWFDAEGSTHEDWLTKHATKA
jgi:hypothetical protein